MSFADPGELVGEILVNLPRHFVRFKMDDLCDRFQRGLIEGRTDVEFWSTGDDDSEGKRGGDEAVKELENMLALFLNPTLVEAIDDEDLWCRALGRGDGGELIKDQSLQL